jgi:hypothetical protein
VRHKALALQKCRAVKTCLSDSALTSKVVYQASSESADAFLQSLKTVTLSVVLIQAHGSDRDGGLIQLVDGSEVTAASLNNLDASFLPVSSLPPSARRLRRVPWVAPSWVRGSRPLSAARIA